MADNTDMSDEIKGSGCNVTETPEEIDRIVAEVEKRVPQKVSEQQIMRELERVQGEMAGYFDRIDRILEILRYVERNPND